MIKITSEKLEEVIMTNFNKKVSYVGVLVDELKRKIDPIKFAFFEWDENNKLKSTVIIREKHLLRLIK